MKKLIACLIFLLLGSISAEAASRFLVACATTCTWDGSNTTIWSATSGGSGGQSVPGPSDTVTLDANTCAAGTTCTITVNVDVNVQWLKLGACTASTSGCILDFSVNNNNVTISDTTGTGLFLTGTGVRTLRMGSGLWSFTGSATVISATTLTNLTLTPNTSTIKFTGSSTASRVFATAAGTTWGNFILDTGQVTFSQANISFAAITLNAPSRFFASHSETITATSITSNGSQAHQNYLGTNLFISLQDATISVASGTQTLDWTGIAGIAFTGGATFIANDSFNLGPNTGITINPPTPPFGGVATPCILGG